MIKLFKILFYCAIKWHARITKTIMLLASKLVEVLQVMILWLRKIYSIIIIKYFIKVYQTPDELPAWNYEKAKDDLNYLRKNYKKRRLNEVKESYLRAIYDKITYELIDIHGIDNEYFNYISKYRNLLLLRCEYLRTLNRKLINNIKYIEREIDEYLNKSDDENMTINEKCAMMSSYFGFHIDSKKISINQFKYFEKRYIKEVEKNG